MELVHKGFDKLEIAIKAGLPMRLASIFEHAKSLASDTDTPTPVDINGVRFFVASSGMMGGYRYRANTGTFGEEWWFKQKTSHKDAWGIRVRVSSVRIAVRGWSEAKKRIHDTLEALGIVVLPHEYSIGRIDFAMDFLFPSFEPISKNFVMGHRFKRNQNAIATEYIEAGRTDRVETVTVGKMPGRQLQIYDKRAEVISKKDRTWFEIYNHKRRAAGESEFDFSDPSISRIWRLELRAGKKHLKEDWKVSSWSQVETTAPRIFKAMLRDIRYVVPSATDQNRSRWPNHRLWDGALEALKGDLFNLESDISEERLYAVQLLEWEDMIRSQISGSMIAMAARRGVSRDQLCRFAMEHFSSLLDGYEENKAHTERRLSKARKKYGLADEGETIDV